MSRIKNKSGRFLNKTVLGRRFCSHCGLWRHVCYFRPRRHRNGREYPQSECDMCHNREVKHDRRCLVGDRRVRRQEYERMQKERERRRRGIQPRWDYGPAQLDGKKAAAWIGRFITHTDQEHAGGSHRRTSSIVVVPVLNGKRLPPEDSDYISALRRGKIKYLSAVRADEICTVYELPLWELEEAAS